ncbi:unnamed protein product [Gongylonema pulchrum]|uniref:Pre-rRNA-processing protein TSR2 homolog n=1 Tax=Gongylonema pulchrum TaxID=637853 RepID=A0A183E6G6_9BILA|nr:unnamed protein product [Gongylonema pulchrum]
MKTFKVLADYVLKTKNLQEESLVEWISEILDEEFDLLMEDNSTDWIAASLLKCRDWLVRGQKAEFEEFLSKLPPDSAVESAKAQSRVADSAADEESSEGEDPVQESEQETATHRPSRTTECDEDGWTVVTRGRRL